MKKKNVLKVHCVNRLKVAWVEVWNHCWEAPVVFFFRTFQAIINKHVVPFKDRHGRDRMVVGFITTYAISAYHH